MIIPISGFRSGVKAAERTIRIGLAEDAPQIALCKILLCLEPRCFLHEAIVGNPR